MSKNYYVYILASRRNGTLYTGVTNDLERRMYEHKNHSDINSALQREKQLKKWNRKWKLELIEKSNPNWLDLVKGWKLDPRSSRG